MRTGHLIGAAMMVAVTSWGAPASARPTPIEGRHGMERGTVAPRITGVAPGEISRCGGMTVTVTGSGLGGATFAALGDDSDHLAVGRLRGVSDTRVTFIAPRRPEGGRTRVWLGTRDALLGSVRITILDADECAGRAPTVPPNIWTISKTTLSGCGGEIVTLKGAGLHTILNAGIARSQTETYDGEILEKTESKIRFRTPRVPSPGGGILYVITATQQTSYKPVTITKC